MESAYYMLNRQFSFYRQGMVGQNFEKQTPYLKIERKENSKISCTSDILH